jgi:hypothetical protein
MKIDGELTGYEEGSELHPEGGLKEKSRMV